MLPTASQNPVAGPSLAAPSFSFGGGGALQQPQVPQMAPGGTASAAPAPPAAPAAGGASLSASPQPSAAVASAPAFPTAAPVRPKETPASPPPPPPPSSFMAQFQRALDTKTLPPSLAAEVKTRFAAPYTVPAPISAPSNAAPLPSAYPGQQGQQQQQQQQQQQPLGGGGGWGGLGGGFSSSSSGVNAGRGGLGLPTGLPTAGPHAPPQGQQAADGDPATSSVAEMQTRNMAEFLSVLLSCDSGYMNAYDNAVSTEKNLHANKEVISGLHNAVGSIACASASSILAHLKKELSPAALGYDGIGAALHGVPHTTRVMARPSAAGGTLVGADESAGRALHHMGSNPLMAGAQCLYLLTRHFQMQPSLVKEGLELVELLLTHVQTELSGRRVPSLDHFRSAPETTALCSLTWLVVLSVANAVAVWKRVLATTGNAVLSHNSLIHSDVAGTLGRAVAVMQTKFEDAVLAGSAEAVGKRDDNALSFLSNAGGGRPSVGLAGSSNGAGAGSVAAMTTAAALLRSGAAHVAANYRWLTVVEAFLSVLTLAEGCLLCAKGDEKGFDRALEAFTGDRANPLSEVFGGKVAKRLVQLAPAPSTLSIPIDYIYIVPYEILSYLFDDMLPLIRHIAALEVDTDRAYLDEVQRWEEAFPLNVEAGGRYGSPGGDNGHGGAGYRLPANAALMHGGNGADNGLFSGRRDHYAPEGYNYGYPDGSGGAMRRDGSDAARFTTEMGSILGCIAQCLEHLSPDVLDPDLDSDCSVTFFVFRNCVKHLSQVFSLQRSGGSALWETFALVIVSRFLEVLAMIGRNPQYISRVVAMLTEAQTECPEMQWGSLVNQALECAGFSSTEAGGTAGANHHYANHGADPNRGLGGGFLHSGGGSHPNKQPTEAQQQQLLPQQFTVEFARQCQQQYISSFFMFLRQVFAQPVIREVVAEYVTLELALSFVFAPWQSQRMLGSTLSLISSLVLTPADAALVWSFLGRNALLQPPHLPPSPSPAEGALNRGTRHANGRGPQPPQSLSLPYRDESLSLLGHCLFEGTIGVYSITVGFLDLMISLFRYSDPGAESLPLFASVAHFIAQDVLIGVSKRSFTVKKERYTVVALAAAALRHALAVRFTYEAGGTGDPSVSRGTGGNSTGSGNDNNKEGGGMVIPFATVMAPIKSPADVTGEALKVVYKASSSLHELASHQRTAVRECLQLLTAAIRAVRERQIEVFAFDSRTTQSVSLAYHTLFLCGANDPLLMGASLELLLQFPRPVMAQATSYWHADAEQLSYVVALFADLLHPLSVAALDHVVRAPPELALLDADPNDLSPTYHGQEGGGGDHALAAGRPESLARGNRSLLLDLLITHALNVELSVTVWLCGFFDASSGSAVGDTTVQLSLVNQLTNTQLLDAIVAGATSSTMERESPGLAVKYVKLIYQLRSNRLYGSTLMRGFMESACQELFLDLQRFRADQCSPVLLSKYAYVLKLLALEALDVYNTTPDHLDVNRMVVPSIPAEVLLSLLHPSRHNGGGGGDDPNGCYNNSLAGYNENNPSTGNSRADLVDAAQSLPRGLSADMAQWLPQCFTRLASFPSCSPPNGRDRYLLPAAQDGIVQFNVKALYEAFQQEQSVHGLAPLTMEDFRAKLGPFIEANQCFLEYTSAINFVEGWCQLLEISCTVVRGMSAQRMRSLFVCIIKAMDETTRMTLAAQERVAFHLFGALTTVATILKQRCRTEAEAPDGEAGGVAGLSVYDRPPSGNGRLSLVDRSASRMGNAVAGGGGTTAGPPPGASLAGSAAGRFRRPREEWERSSGGGNVFATQASNRSNLLSLANRTRLARSALLTSDVHSTTGYGYHHQDIAGGELAFTTLMEGYDGGGEMTDAAANQSLFRRLVVALVQWGTRIPVLRGDAYTSLMCLTQIPGVSADDFVVFRCQDALFDLIAADITGTSSVHGTTTPLRRERALLLLLQLLQTSPALCSAFSGATEGPAAGIGQRPLLCAKALLRDVDAVVSGFLAGVGPSTASSAQSAFGLPAASSRSFGGVLFSIRAAFDYLALLSMHHAPQVLQGNVIAVCMVMECWDRCSQVVFGGAPAANARTAAGAGPHRETNSVGVMLEQNKEVLKRLLLGTVRWFNVMQAAVGDAPQFVAHMQEFVRLRRQLIEYCMDLVQSIPVVAEGGGGGGGGGGTAAVPAVPASAAPTTIQTASVNSPTGWLMSAEAAPTAWNPFSGPASSSLNTVTLALLAELTELLRGLSASPLAEECRVLVTEMALTELSVTVSSDAFAQYCQHYVYGDYFESQLRGSGGGGGGQRGAAIGSPPPPPSLFPPTAGPSSASLAVVNHNSNDGALHSSSLAELHLDLVALSTCNLAHFLLRSEYGRRAYAENADEVDAETIFPRLRSQRQHIQNVLQTTQQVAQALDNDGAAALAGNGVAGVSELRLECRIFALHALVCLVHSFVLPLPAGKPEERSESFLPYLASLPLTRMRQLLEYCQTAVYRHKDFNADYRSGITGLRTADGGWAVAAHSISNVIASSRVRQGTRLVQGRSENPNAARDGSGSVTAPSTPALSAMGSGNANANVNANANGLLGKRNAPNPPTPSTPLFSADAGNHLQGTHPQSIEARHRRTNADVGNGDHAAVTARSAPGGSGGMAHTSMLALNTEPVTQTVDSLTGSRQDLNGWGDDGATVAVGTAPEQTTVGQLWADSASADPWAALASSDTAAPSWESVLSMESSVRQLKIAIANALRATSSAIDVVSRV